MRHDDILILGSVEDGDPAVLGQLTFDTPQIVVIELLAFGSSETVIVHAHRIALAEHMPYDATLARGIHALQHDEQAPT